MCDNLEPSLTILSNYNKLYLSLLGAKNDKGHLKYKYVNGCSTIGHGPCPGNDCPSAFNPKK